MEKSIIIGAGGHALVILQILQELNREKIEGFVNIYENELKEVSGYPILATPKDLSILENIQNVYFAIGDNYKRYIWVNLIKQKYNHLKYNALIHPKSIISKNCTIEEGSVICAGAIVQPGSSVGEFSLINTASVLEHNGIMDKFSSLAPKSCTGGNVKIGEYTAIGLNATILQNRVIGNNSVIGAGSIVTKNIPDNVVAYGVPCRIIRERKIGDSYL